MPNALNKDGLLKSAPATIFTFGGGTIEPLNPNPDDITIEAIAHSLSQQCRWTGHCNQFYSVAEHCFFVSEIVADRWGEEQALAALLHDASEAYLADLARPIKHAPGLGEIYLECERRLEEAIAVKFGLPAPPMSAEVKKADDEMLRQEAKQLVPHLGEIMPDPEDWTPTCSCWNPTLAELYFLDAYKVYAK